MEDTIWILGVYDKKSGYGQVHAVGKESHCKKLYETMKKTASHSGLDINALRLISEPAFSKDQAKQFLHDRKLFTDFIKNYLGTL
jgi:hypothetical protein